MQDMDVDVVLEGLNVLWQKEVDGGMSTKSLFKHFCQSYGLNPATCQLNYNGNKVADQAIAQVDPALTSVLTLSVAFKCTLAFSTWQRLMLADDCIGQGSSEMWLKLAQSLATNCGWSLLEMDQHLSMFVASAPLDELPDSMLSESTRKIWWWESVKKPARPVLLLLDTYQHALGMHLLDDVPKPNEQAAVQSVIACTNYIRSRQPCGELSVFELLDFTQQAGYITNLRAALLLIKLLSFVSYLPPLDNADTHKVGVLICSALTTICSKMRDVDITTSGTLGIDGTNADERHAYVRKLSLVLLQMAVLTAQMLIRSGGALSSAGAICGCSVFDALMPANRLTLYAVVAPKIVASGGITVLIASLWMSPAVVNKALGVIESLLSDSLPVEVVQLAATIMLRMKAVDTLADRLSPDFLADKLNQDTAVVGKGDSEWRCDSTQKKLALMVRAAKVINNLLGRSPAPSDPMQALPTPTPAVWTSIQQTHAKVQETLDWLSDEMVSKGGNGQDSVQTGYQRLHQELIKVSSNLVVGHLPNLDLDVLDIMRASLIPVLQTWSGAQKPSQPLVDLGMACLRRLSRDQSILNLAFYNSHGRGDRAQGTAQGKGKGKGKGKVPPRQPITECHGCNKCYGPDWGFKTVAVASLWLTFCHQASRGSAAAAASTEALYHALLDHEQCKHLLLGTHKQVYLGDGVHAGFAPAIRSLEGDLTAQLTAGACWARLCSQRLKGASRGLALEKASNLLGLDGVLEDPDLVSQTVQSALAKHLPWSTELCVAFARMLYNLKGLRVKDTPGSGQADGDSLLAFCTQMDSFVLHRQLIPLLPQLAEITKVKALQRQLLFSIINLAMPALQSLKTIDAILKETTSGFLLATLVQTKLALEDAASETSAEATAYYTGTGLPEIPKQVVQPLLLGAFWLVLDVPFAHERFGRHVATYCVEWMMELTQSGADILKVDGQVLDLAPYCQVCAQYGQLLPEGTPPAPLGMAFRSVLNILIRLVEPHMQAVIQLQEAKHHEDKRGSVPSGDSNSLEDLEHVAVQTRRRLETALRSVESIRQDPFWMPSIVSLEGITGNGSSKKMYSEVMYYLVEDRKCGKVLSAAILQRIQVCFLPLTSAQVGRTEASAQTAYEQLLEETKQAAARAAAKKAKKLKQKAKKQQDQQPQSPSENEAPSVNGTSQAPDKLLQHDSEADEMTDGVLPMRDLPSSSSLPDAEGSRNMPVVFKADGNATNAAASRDAALQTRHDRIASSLSALSVCDSSEEEEVGAMQEDPDAGHDHAATGQAATAPGHNEVRLDTDTHRLQNIFCCPITKALMVEPVIAADGHTYERAALEAWLLHSSTSPVTGDPLAHTRIVPNVLIRSAIATSLGR